MKEQPFVFKHYTLFPDAIVSVLPNKMYIGHQMFISFLVLFETLHFSAKQRRVLYKYKVIGQQ